MDRILIEELIIAAMPIKSLITAPQTDRQQVVGAPLTVRGHAWVASRRFVICRKTITYGL
jgi:hypothetical protein|tara:strand:+ start:144 stop:323 length:180 start_codon:yes stop_codon:yes gene_type:complete